MRTKTAVGAAKRLLLVTAVAGAMLAGVLAAPPESSAAAATTTVSVGVSRASSYASARAYINAVTVMDMKTGRTWQAGSTERLFGAGSVMKVIIATKILATGHMHGRVATRAFRMITLSDDEDASYLWGEFGQTRIITWVGKHYGISDLGTPNDLPGFWGNTHITSHGIAELYYHALRDPKVGPWLSNAMHHYRCRAADGTNQCWGIVQAASGAGIKQGWSAGVGSADNTHDSIIHSTGLVDHDRYAVVILTEGVGTAGQSDSRGVVRAEASAVTAMARLTLSGGKITPTSAVGASTTGDVDGDKRADLITRQPNGTLWLYRNTGSMKRLYSGPTQIGLSGWQVYDRIVAADVDGDGRADLVASRPDGTLWLYRYAGGATRPYPRKTEIGLSGWQGYGRIVAADVDGDGRADLVASRPSGTLWLYRNTGSLTRPYRHPRQIGRSGWQVYDRITLADVNGDKRAELVATKPDGTLWLYTNTRSTTRPFRAPRKIGLSGWAGFDRITMGDVNRDGRTDLVARRPDGTLWLYGSTGSLTRPYRHPAQIGLSGWRVFDLLL